jgi:hypothetical protein
MWFPHDDGVPHVSHPAEVRMVGKVGVVTAGGEVDDVKQRAAGDEQHAHRGPPQVARLPAPARQHGGNERRDAAH